MECRSVRGSLFHFLISRRMRSNVVGVGMVEGAERTEDISHRDPQRTETSAPPTRIHVKPARRWAALRAAWIERRTVSHVPSEQVGTCETVRLSIHVPAEGRRPTAGQGLCPLRVSVRNSPCGLSVLTPQSLLPPSRSLLPRRTDYFLRGPVY